MSSSFLQGVSFFRARGRRGHGQLRRLRGSVTWQNALEESSARPDSATTDIAREMVTAPTAGGAQLQGPQADAPWRQAQHPVHLAAFRDAARLLPAGDGHGDGPRRRSGADSLGVADPRRGARRGCFRRAQGRPPSGDPRAKIFGSVLMGVGVGLLVFGGQWNIATALVVGAIAGALHLGAFGLDPLKDKGLEGVDRLQTDRHRAQDRRGRKGAGPDDRRDQARPRPSTGGARRQLRGDGPRECSRSSDADPREPWPSAPLTLGPSTLQGARDATVSSPSLAPRNREPRRSRADYIGFHRRPRDQIRPSARQVMRPNDAQPISTIETGEVLRPSALNREIRFISSNEDRTHDHPRVPTRPKRPPRWSTELNAIVLPEPSRISCPCPAADEPTPKRSQSGWPENRHGQAPNSIVSSARPRKAELQQITSRCCRA